MDKAMLIPWERENRRYDLLDAGHVLIRLDFNEGYFGYKAYLYRNIIGVFILKVRVKMRDYDFINYDHTLFALTEKSAMNKADIILKEKFNCELLTQERIDKLRLLL